MQAEIVNFGENIRWTPSHWYRPPTESDLLAILERHRTEQVRAVASLHSWSPVAKTSGVSVDMGEFNQVEVVQDGDLVSVWVGAGCVLQDLLDQLHQSTEWTLPTLGAIKKQTLAGAVSTGTHGSGSPGLSHFVQAARLARIDPKTGRAEIVEVTQGQELRAVRCGLGCTGLLLSLKISCRPRYLVRETLRHYTQLSAMLAESEEHTLSFFALLPYSRDLVAWQRKSLPWRPLSWLERAKALLYRWHKFIGTDILLHVFISGLKHLGLGAHQRFFGLLPSLLLLNQSVLDESEPQLTLAHDLFRHVEMELFVPEQDLSTALEIVSDATSVFAGDLGSLSAGTRELLEAQGWLKSLLAGQGRYRHHYPFVIRKVLPEDTLISMASGDRVWYSISVFSYARDLSDYEAYCEWLAGALNGLFGARLHWGKHCPLDHHSLAPQYPELEGFKTYCQSQDPAGTFRNPYVDRVLGFPAPSSGPD